MTASLVAQFGHVVALRVEALLRVSGVVDYLQFAPLVVVAVPWQREGGIVSPASVVLPPLEDAVVIPLLVLELSVVAHASVVAIPVVSRKMEAPTISQMQRRP